MIETKIHQFCYVVEPMEAFAAEAGCGRPGGFRIVYLGQFKEQKGLAVLLRALASFRELEWQADLIGSGPLESQNRALIRELGLSRQVFMYGAQERGTAMAMLARADVLVLPSIYDGWGAVVNEALMLGVPVICTGACGSADLITESWRGTVVRPGSIFELAAALVDRVRGGPLCESQRTRIRSWTQAIAGPRVAAYFSDVIRHVYGGSPRPRPPWTSSMLS